ncbi:signal transduction histidine kinase/CheY-like chemotaxis protein [Elusimicrobium simillimum]|uniref:ATP-binding protein n=1 Tax=Elusimicrobium simillimum TaxID=3143438 RepID=UPI003C702B38
MGRYFFKTIQGRIVGLFVVFMTLMFAVSFYTIRYASQNAMEKEKETKLLSVAKYQDYMLGAQNYDAILANAGASNASRENQIAALNSALKSKTDEVASLFPGLGTGYYSLELDSIVTYGPSAEHSDAVGVSIPVDHPGRTVMKENKGMVQTGSMVRGHIMNAMYPIERDGKVIGYAWANELTSGIEQEYRDFSNGIIMFLAFFYFASLFIAIMLSRRMMRNIDTIIDGVKNMRRDITARIENVEGELGEVANNINNMARDIEKNAEEHELLLRAEAATEAQRDFLSHMSHEMRTPMNAVIGMSNIARQTNDIEKMHHCLVKIDTAANHLLGVINDVLDMSKIEAGKLELSKINFSFKQMLDQVVTVITFKMEEKKQNLKLEIYDNVPEYLLADRQRLAQVITNLLSNANKFSPVNGNIYLRVNRLDDEDGMCRLRIEVEDDGIGISPEQQARLFQSFKQANNSISRQYGGTGLGLVISKRIVEMMQGRIWIESELGRGAKFIFEIKADFSNAAENADDDAQAGKAVPAPEEGILKGKRILLAEDVEINREIVLALLEPTGVEIDSAENGAEALRMFSESPEKYDLIFMDMQMPEMDGFEATRRIRALDMDKAKKIPIIAMTANVFKEDIDKCLAAGMNGHIGKPLDFEEVLAELHNWLA